MKTFTVTVQSWNGFTAKRHELRVKANTAADVARGLNRRRWDDWQILSIKGA